MDLEEKAAVEQFFRQQGKSPEEIQQLVQNMEQELGVGEQIFQHQLLQLNTPGEIAAARIQHAGGFPGLWKEYQKFMIPGVPTLQAATGLPPVPRPPQVGAREPQEGDPFYEPPPADLGTVTVEGSRSGRAWGGGGYVPNPGTRVVGGETIPGGGFPSLTGGPILAGNTPEIAQRAATAGLTETTGTGAYSPIRSPEQYLNKSWQEVRDTESPLIQDLWQEEFNRQQTNDLMQAGARAQTARARIAEQQAVEAELPFEEQMQRYVARQMAVRNAILEQSAPLIESTVETQIQQMKEVYLRATKQPMPPQLEAQKRAELQMQIQNQAVQSVLSTMTPDVLGRIAASGVVNPAMLQLLAQGGGGYGG